MPPSGMLHAGERLRMSTVHPATLRLAALVEFSDDAIISQTLEGTIETWNRGAERMFGYEASEAIGQSIDLIVPTDRRAEEQAMIARIRRGETVEQVETIAVTRSGSILPISLAVSALLTADGTVVGVSRVARDTSRQRMLEREALRLAAIVDSSEDAIASKDLNGIVQTWNKAAERMFGYTAAEIVGRPILLIIPPERRAEEDDVLARIRAGRSIEHFETVRRRKDGRLIEISLSVSPIRTPGGAIIGASKIARDITLQHRLVRAAEEASRAKDEFLATLSHELRTPLNAVLGYTRMLRIGQVDDARRERTIEVIERNAQILAQLVADVLDVSSIVTGKIRLNPSACDVAAVIQAAADVVRPAAEAKGVTLHLDLDASLESRCDTDRMQQVLWNLLSNAVKFTPQGGRITVRARRHDGMVEVAVTDTGIGLRPESLPYLFQRFWQAESVQSREIGGLGLGLALARHFVELHGGTIAAASRGPGQGSTFTLKLPLNPGSSH